MDSNEKFELPVIKINGKGDPQQKTNMRLTLQPSHAMRPRISMRVHIFYARLPHSAIPQRRRGPTALIHCNKGSDQQRSHNHMAIRCGTQRQRRRQHAMGGSDCHRWKMNSFKHTHIYIHTYIYGHMHVFDETGKNTLSLNWRG